MKIVHRMAMGLSVVGLTMALAGSAPAADHSGHAGHAGMAPPADKGGQSGVEIRKAVVDGYQLHYRLLNWQERNAAMKGMEGMEMAGMDNSGNSTHHLVLYIAGAGGREVSGGKVGFQVTRPDGGEQKTLTMAMGGGYGADVNLKARGVYTIRTKFVDGAKTGVDTFTHEVR